MDRMEQMPWYEQRADALAQRAKRLAASAPFDGRCTLTGSAVPHAGPSEEIRACFGDSGIWYRCINHMFDERQRGEGQ